MIRVAAVVEQCWHAVPGGTAVATVRSLEALAARGDTEVVGLAARHRRPPNMATPQGVATVHMGLPRRVLYDSWHRLRWPHTEGAVGPVDVVHATGGVVPPARRAALAVTVHDLAFLVEPRWFTPRGVRFATTGFELAKRHADLVIVPSQATATSCAERGISTERLRVVRWGVSPVKVSDTEMAAVRARHRLPETFALWVGTAEPRKNLSTLLAAAARTCCEVPFVLVGPQGWGSGPAEKAGTGSGASQGNPARVIRLGFVAEHELAALYAAARVFVYPSLMEGFGLPVLEAMAQGTPVVTSAGTATAEVCADPASLVDPRDAEALAAAVDQVVTDDPEHARRSAAALARAGELTWASTAQGIRSAYGEVVA